jgi:hypothetical protein
VLSAWLFDWQSEFRGRTDSLDEMLLLGVGEKLRY